MTFSNPNPRSTATWQTEPPATRWQALQAQLSRRGTANVSPWLRRSRVISRWHVAPAVASTPGA